MKLLSRVQLFATPWTVAYQAPLSMGFSRQESWSGLPYLPPGNLPDPGIKPMSVVSPALAGGFFTLAPPGKLYNAPCVCMCVQSRFSPVQLFATLWTVAYQAPLSIGFSRQEYWSGLPCLSPGDLFDLGIEPTSLVWASAGRFFFTSPWEKMNYLMSNGT